ncbi:hypothetical protein QVO02_03295 [Yersinia mollaretii]|nr:hypothetical protein [Yersinia mollaretii]MDN0109620.1 hypothetical protein [Yersinia mollaretii]
MNTQTQITEILRLLHNLIRIGTVAEVEVDQALCQKAQMKRLFHQFMS